MPCHAMSCHVLPETRKASMTRSMTPSPRRLDCFSSMSHSAWLERSNSDDYGTNNNVVPMQESCSGVVSKWRHSDSARFWTQFSPQRPKVERKISCISLEIKVHVDPTELRGRRSIIRSRKTLSTLFTYVLMPVDRSNSRLAAVLYRGLAIDQFFAIRQSFG